MRIRTIKPEFFRHETLAELGFEVRLAFIGLWGLADVEGRLEDRPRRIKVEIFPYDEIDMDAVIAQLANAGFLHRYEVDGKGYIAIGSFRRHQRFSGKEASETSKHPAPPGEAAGKHSGSIGEATGKHLGSQERNMEYGVGNKERKPRATRVSLPEGFTISERVAAWAQAKGYSHLAEHLEHFIGIAKAKGYLYADWDSAFMNAVRSDWAKLNGKRQPSGKVPLTASEIARLQREGKEWRQ